MKRILALMVIAIYMGLIACNSSEKEVQSETTEENVGIQVLDFHSTHRCVTCNTIEEKTRATLASFYNEQVEKGLITFQTINVDEEENQAIAEEYGAFGTALFITVVKEGETNKVDLTEFAFMNAMNDDTSFEEGLKMELDKALNAL